MPFCLNLVDWTEAGSAERSVGSDKRRAAICIAAALLAMVPVRCDAAALLLRWTSVSSATGYRVYFGKQSRVYKRRRAIDSRSARLIGGVTYFLIRGLRRNHHYFVSVTAFNDVGESDFSNEKNFLADRSADLRADAGPNQIGQVGVPLRLGGPRRPGLSYVWFQRRGPAATLAKPTASQTSFIPSMPGVYKFLLVAFDARSAADTDTVRVIVPAPSSRYAMVSAPSDLVDPAGLASSDMEIVESTPSPTPTATPSPGPIAP